MKINQKYVIVILVAIVCVSFSAAVYYYRQNRQLRSIMITASAEIIAEGIWISYGSIRGALDSSIESQELDYHNNKQILDSCYNQWNQFDYLEAFDPEHRDEWREFEFMSRQLWDFFSQLEQRILPDDAIQLDREETEWLTELYDNLGIISGFTDIEFPGFNAQHLELDESVMSQSLEASDNILELVEEGFIVFDLDAN